MFLEMEHGSNYTRSHSSGYKLIVCFQTCDFLNPEDPVLREGAVDVCLDKGTFDAISLSTEASENKKQYILSVVRVLKAGGYLIITSCNWTAEELKKYFSTGITDIRTGGNLHT